MEGTTMRNLAGLIAQHHRGNRDYNRTGQHAAFDTTVGEDLGGTEGISGGDAGCNPDSPGQNRDNLSR